MSDTDETERRQPNILITGTPGVGKTVTAALIAVSPFAFTQVMQFIILTGTGYFNHDLS